MKLINYLFFFILFCSMDNDKYTFQKEKIFYETLGSFIKKKQKQGFEVGGVGGGEEKGKDNYFHIMFKIEKKLTIEEGRKLAIKTVHEFLEHINNTKKIQNNLIQFPLTEEFVSISIWGEDIDKKDQAHIESVSAGGGSVYFYSGSLAQPNFGVVHKETFEEAERIVREQEALIVQACPNGNENELNTQKKTHRNKRKSLASLFRKK